MQDTNLVLLFTYSNNSKEKGLTRNKLIFKLLELNISL